MSAKNGDAASGRALAVPPFSQMTSHKGLVRSRSDLNRHETIERLVAALATRALPVVARVDHAAAAHAAGLAMLPAELFIFGNPLAGTPLMQASPSMAIDLPLKILVSVDPAEVCWLIYNDPLWIGRRHGIVLPQSRILRAMRDLLAAISNEAAGRDELAK